jgi:hypothetical protein
MPKGVLRRVRQMVAGLLVLAVLLFTGPQPSIAVLAGAQDMDAAGLTVAATDHGMIPPCQDGDHDSGLPCCIGSQCVAHAFWLPAPGVNLPHLSQIAVVSPPSREGLHAGISTEPTSPPPRGAV